MGVIFQSQLGSIGAKSDILRSSCSASLSIPAWFDWRTIQVSPHEVRVSLSIPAWFDWRLRLLIAITPFFLTFNPSLVRLALSRRRRSCVR